MSKSWFLISLLIIIEHKKCEFEVNKDFFDVFLRFFLMNPLLF